MELLAISLSWLISKNPRKTGSKSFLWIQSHLVELIMSNFMLWRGIDTL
jgi:hypothetical protein